RVFPLTFKYLTEEFEFNQVFDNFNSIGSNTFPNVLAAFAGLEKEPRLALKLKDETDYYQKALNQSTYHDMYPLIWNEYEENNYTTTYSEDYGETSCFINRL